MGVWLAHEIKLSEPDRELSTKIVELFGTRVADLRQKLSLDEAMRALITIKAKQVAHHQRQVQKIIGQYPSEDRKHLFDALKFLAGKATAPGSVTQSTDVPRVDRKHLLQSTDLLEAFETLSRESLVYLDSANCFVVTSLLTRDAIRDALATQPMQAGWKSWLSSWLSS